MTFVASLLTALSLIGAHPLAGQVVGIDPGHDGGNFAAPGMIDRPVWNGREAEACDTTGTETDGGYTEARFNFAVATYLRDDLAGLNFTTVPKVLIECVNMRNAADAARLVKPSFQKLAAKSMAEAITGFLKSR